jgi:hypothetical protein
MTEPWVVTYEILTRKYDERAGWLDCHTTTLFFTGSEDECQRIAEASAAPTTYDGSKVLEFRPIIAPLADWEEHLRDIQEAFDNS